MSSFFLFWKTLITDHLYCAGIEANSRLDTMRHIDPGYNISTIRDAYPTFLCFVSPYNSNEVYSNRKIYSSNSYNTCIIFRDCFFPLFLQKLSIDFFFVAQHVWWTKRGPLVTAQYGEIARSSLFLSTHWGRGWNSSTSNCRSESHKAGQIT